MVNSISELYTFMDNSDATLGRKVLGEGVEEDGEVHDHYAELSGRHPPAVCTYKSTTGVDWNAAMLFSKHCAAGRVLPQHAHGSGEEPLCSCHAVSSCLLL